MNSGRRTKIDEHLKQIETGAKGFSPDSIQAPNIAKIHVLIAEEQAESAEKLERYTVALVRLTWAVIALTVVLVGIELWKLAHGK
jgi:alkanesulfonate monooxygenase SsuD/methylene tetrahydromethanopterin reductase-like flavin-dependent oxidoreductase (luciferase family)